jgi:hypothetical protein
VVASAPVLPAQSRAAASAASAIRLRLLTMDPPRARHCRAGIIVW